MIYVARDPMGITKCTYGIKIQLSYGYIITRLIYFTYFCVFSFVFGAPGVEERISICIYRREIYKNMEETAQLSSENKRKRGM